MRRITLENATDRELHDALQSAEQARIARAHNEKEHYTMPNAIKDVPLIRCEYCDTEFERTRMVSKYCSTKCRVYAHRAKRRLAKSNKLERPPQLGDTQK